MSGPDKLRDELAHAIAAEGELAIVAPYLDRLEAQYLEAWRATEVRDADARERLWQAVQIVGKVRGHLKSIAGGRRLVEAQLAEIARLETKRATNS